MAETSIVVRPTHTRHVVLALIVAAYMITYMDRVNIASAVPVIAVTPIIGDAAVKGPTAKIMKELGIAPSPLAVIEHYRGLIDGFVLDSRDAHLSDRIDIPVKICDTLMLTLEDRQRVASSALDLATALLARAR